MKGIALAFKHPKLADEWHPTKNGKLTPFDVSSGSDKKIWWKCPKGDDHEWEASPNKRTSRGDGCTICSNRKIVLSNCLNTTHPEIAKEWNLNKNNKNPFNVVFGSNEYAWWKCSKNENHIWKAKISNRTINKTGCPFCSSENRGIRRSNAKIEKSLATFHPDILKFWNYEKNTKSPNSIYPTSSIKYYWNCNIKNHPTFLMGIAERIKSKYNCPICAKEGAIKNKLKAKQGNSFGDKFPELIKEWNFEKNKPISPFDINPYSQKKYWWTCSKNSKHIYLSSLSNKTNIKSGCPICRGLKVDDSNALSIRNPKLATEWHKTKNKLSPNEVTENSHKKVWWQCLNNQKHIWFTSISNRKYSNCPYCVGQKTLEEDSVGKLYPKLITEWDYEKNTDYNPFKLSPKSGVKIWWKCSRDNLHTWKTRISHRTIIKTNCPYCTLTPQSKQELQITFELKYFFPSINPKGYKLKIENKLLSIDIYIPELNLAIEFDGSYWHRNRESTDTDKTNLLVKNGLNVLRIREFPLKKILQSDIISELPFDAKNTTNKVLMHVKSYFNLDVNMNSEIRKYVRRKKLQNENELDVYIDGLLREKK